MTEAASVAGSASSSETEPALELRNATVSYGDSTALDQVNLSIDHGETVAIIGPSGCGKSTMLRAIAGLEPLASGTILSQGIDLANVPTHQRDLGLMFQDHALFPHLDVAANVAFGIDSKRPGPRAARVTEMLELVGLAGFGSRTVDQLSGGEAQRVALARALAPAPKLLMLDEPLGSLDRVLREQLTADLRRLIRALGVTVLHVTHDQAEAFALADRVVVLRDGRVEQVGSPAELWQRPASPFVATFVGHHNVWPTATSWQVVPMSAITVLDSSVSDSAVLADGAGSSSHMSVIVDYVAFHEGRYTIEANESSGASDARAVTFELEATEGAPGPAPGDRLRLLIDQTKVY